MNWLFFSKYKEENFLITNQKNSPIHFNSFFVISKLTQAIVLISPMMEQDNKEGVSNDVKLKVEMELQNIEYFSPNLSMN